MASKDLSASIEKSKLKNNCDAFIGNNSKNKIKDWGTNSGKYTLSFKDNVLCASVHGAGLQYESFGKSFLTVDLAKNPILRVRAKSLGKSAPELRVDLVDMKGYATNGKEINRTVSNDGQYADYYYNFKSKMYQGWPETKAVDGKLISEIMVFVNPGGPAYFGEVYISEIEVVNEEKKPKETMTKLIARKDTSNISVFAQGDDISTWWTANRGLEVKAENGLLSLNISKVDNMKYIAGTGFNVIDFVKHPVLMIKAKAEGINTADLRVDLYDTEGASTNAMPLIKELEPNGKYYLLYYDFTDKFKQKSPIEASVDPSKISGLGIFINKNQPAFKGKIVVKEISVLSLNHLKNIKQ